MASALRDRADVVSSRAASGAARNANIEGIGATGISDFADAVNAQIAIVGEVEVTGGGRRRRHRRRSPSTRTVRMVAYAASGEELARAEFSPPAGRRGNDEIDQESQALYGRAQTAWDALHAAPPPEPEPEHHWEPEPEPEEPSEAPQDGLAFLSAWVGLVIRTRDALVTLAAPGERRYGATYAELGLAAELRPFASEAHLGRGTFVTFDFFHSVGLGSVVDDPAMSSVDSTNFARLQLMAGWMAPLGDVVELGVGIGGGFEGYYFAPNPVLPTTEIAYIRPAARGRVRLLEETVVLELDLAYRAVLGTGDIAGSFGQDAETHGVDVGAGLTGNLSRIADLGFTWAVRFHYVGYFMSYAGVASDAQGTSGAEQSVRFTILAGWSF
ncbi:MAG: hypothetical protein H6719_26830 [Sandaracinaceae bacterium]|nr:hypothetical protein [Sandaracinaceae bacterium]